MSGSNRNDIVTAIFFLALFIALPFLLAGERYFVGQLIFMFFWAIVASQWNMLFGLAGIFSLAPMALFAFGGYATAMLAFYFDWSVWYAMPLAGLATVVFSLLIGLACLRLTGAYVALLTLAIAQVMYLLIVTDTDCFYQETSRCRSFTGGANGFSRFGDLGTKREFRGDWHIANYFIVFTLFVFSMIFTYIIYKSPMGMAFRALRDNPGYAVSRGINRFKYQLLVFGLSAFFTGLAGALYASHLSAIGVSVFSFNNLLFIIAMAVIGGVGRFWGALIGAILLMGADEVLREFGGDYRTIGLGLILAFFVVAMPQGLLGLLEKLTTRRRPESEAEGSPTAGRHG